MATLLGRKPPIPPAPDVVEVAIHRMTSPAGVCWWATEAGWTSGFFRTFDQLDDHVISRYKGRLFVRVAGESRVGLS